MKKPFLKPAALSPVSDEIMKIFHAEADEIFSSEKMYGQTEKGVVNRLEIIGPGGRKFVRIDVSVELSYQDDGRTLKIFYKENAGIE